MKILINTAKKKMKERITELIEQHREMAKQVFSLLEQLSLYDLDKLSFDEAELITIQESSLQKELSLRNSFVSDLESLLL